METNDNKIVGSENIQSWSREDKNILILMGLRFYFVFFFVSDLVSHIPNGEFRIVSMKTFLKNWIFL